MSPDWVLKLSERDNQLTKVLGNLKNRNPQLKKNGHVNQKKKTYLGNWHLDKITYQEDKKTDNSHLKHKGLEI